MLQQSNFPLNNLSDTPDALSLKEKQSSNITSAF